MMKVVDFLRYVIQRDHLTIAEYLKQMGQDPFFLVAATGLGKTVAVPLHVLIRLVQQLGADGEPRPRVWVVEPRIPIAVDQAKFMNSLWVEYLRSKNEPKLAPLFGCISSASGNINRDAPIKFVTTGIFELMARGGELTRDRDRVIIDEAHVTVEQNPGVELGIVLARKAGVPVDYMSATVDTTGLEDDLRVHNIIHADRQRHVVWKHNLLQPLYEALPDLVRSTLIQPDVSSSYFPGAAFAHAESVRAAVTEPNRSHGLLAVVNSFAGDHSDIRRLTDVVRRSCPELPVLELASEVVRDARRSKEFEHRLKTIETAKQNYVILATSVVEMGITFPTLDFVVTMDSGYDQETIGDVTFPVVAPLGVNSLLQRIGRVGRRRPGIAYISYEAAASYAELEDETLNRAGLRYEPIRFPMTGAPLTTLAYYACTQEWEEVQEWLTDLGLPSRLHENPDRMEYLGEQLEMLEQLGLSDDYRLTAFGEQMGQWIGQADLAYSVQLQRRFNDGAELPELMFWIVATALSNTPLVTLRAQHDFFVDYHGDHQAISHDIDIWSDFDHEDFAAYAIIGLIASMCPRLLLGGSRKPDGWDRSEFDKWCRGSGTDGRKLMKAGDAVVDVWRLFCKINSTSDRFCELFGGRQQVDLDAIAWSTVVAEVPVAAVHDQLLSLPGVTEVAVGVTEHGGLEWHDVHHGHRGLISQDDTPVKLNVGTYTARLVPGREKRDAEATWRLAHLGATVASAEVLAAQASTTLDEAGQRRGRWGRFLDLLLGSERA